MRDGVGEGFYSIGVAAEQLEMHPQTLRKYEQAGFLTPQRMGTLRLYSDEDLERLRVIKHFVEEMGLNISGVELALNITAQLLQLRSRLSAIREPSHSDETTLGRVDDMLSKLGLRVAEQETPERQKELSSPRIPGFEFRPGQVLRFVKNGEQSD